MLSKEPEDKSSITVTRLPNFISSSTKWDPIKLAPPVTRTDLSW